MQPLFKAACTLALAVLATQASAQVTFYEYANFQGKSFTTNKRVGDLANSGFNDRASSVVVVGGSAVRWEACDDVRFGGRCTILRPGQYPSLSAMGLNDRVSSVKPVNRKSPGVEERTAPLPLASQVTFYESEAFRGRTFSSNEPVADFSRYGFNDRASSVIVLGQRWEVCSNSRFNGSCMVLSPGRYDSLASMGMNDRISSSRAVDWNVRVNDGRAAPAPAAVYDSRRRDQESLFTADVTSVRAVVGPAEQRCWIEREEVAATRGDPNVGGAVVGALLGGILGHQVGGGTGKDIATIGGAVAGAAVGSSVGRNSNGQPSTTRDVQRCTDRPSTVAPAFWDVSYTFRGTEHRVQMATPPGATIVVNGLGEPRS